MISELELTSIMKKLKVDIYNTASDIIQDTSIELLSFEDLCRFIKNNNIGFVLYHYTFLEPEFLQITEEIVEQMKKRGVDLEVLRKEIDIYNNSVNQLDFDRPCCLSICCVYQNMIFYWEDLDFWYKEYGFERSEVAACLLLDKHSETIFKAHEESAHKRDEDRLQLRRLILNDEKFHSCTNRDLRRAYIDQLIRDNREVRDLFVAQGGRPPIQKYPFIEDIWREYKTKGQF